MSESGFGGYVEDFEEEDENVGIWVWGIRGRFRRRRRKCRNLGLGDTWKISKKKTKMSESGFVEYVEDFEEEDEDVGIWVCGIRGRFRRRRRRCRNLGLWNTWKISKKKTKMSESGFVEYVEDFEEED